MNNRFKRLSSYCIGIMIALIPLIGCKDGGVQEPSLEEMQNKIRTILAGSWSLNTVTRDGTNITSDYSGFTINFTSNSFTTAGGNTVWPTDDSWTFKPGSKDVIVSGDLVEITIEFANSNSQLTLTFYITGGGSGGRLDEIAGDYVFLLSR